MKVRKVDMYDRLCRSLTVLDELFSTISNEKFLKQARLGPPSIMELISSKLEEIYQPLIDMQDDWEESIGCMDNDEDTL